VLCMEVREPPLATANGLTLFDIVTLTSGDLSTMRLVVSLGASLEK
jgi:hypothetical protein